MIITVQIEKKSLIKGCKAMTEKNLKITKEFEAIKRLGMVK